jgi:spore maturation protein SpmB
MLGLGNAATPLGLRAMRDLDSINARPGTATNAMCTFLAINTSSVQLIPVTAIAILAANRSSNPTAIVGTAMLASACAAVAGVGLAKLLPRFRVFHLPPALPFASPHTRDSAGGTKRAEEALPVKEASDLQALEWWGKLILIGFGIFFFWLFLRLAFPIFGGTEFSNISETQSLFVRIVNAISKLSIPLLLAMFPLYAALRRVKVYEEFVDGAKEGLEVAVRIVPYLVAILVAIGMFRAAGGIDLLSKVLGPAMLAVGFPPELMPLALMRPLSGGGTLGLFTELVKNFGADSFIARTAGTIYGSTETTFYVLAIYFGSVGIKRTRYALIAGLAADFVGVVASVMICRLVFG